MGKLKLQLLRDLELQAEQERQCLRDKDSLQVDVDPALKGLKEEIDQIEKELNEMKKDLQDNNMDEYDEEGGNESSSEQGRPGKA
eukprot:CAMPEP_0202979664 /NCGR_PEP_ID=MMETSP1396-20130829/85750_1 /ASSEMBLY_ACC=CAM_ASM_000872 /TAXON_ID= /ORGANISM="Pseudokeronopsis sp., Strain Brazil" /LENGTH=84 /DNA_ID=CAMNT_0049719197 /DNA_START=1056 /DNA_END=1310 /DNA_ORIENTATION=-